MKSYGKIILILIGALLIATIWRYSRKSSIAPVDKTNDTDNTHQYAQNDKIKLFSPLPNTLISSPLEVRGEARGSWYFEASFPVKLLDANGNQLDVVPAQAQGYWMTEDFVPFTTMLTFPTPSTETGTLILEKDNPSGLPEHADQLKIPVKFR